APTRRKESPARGPACASGVPGARSAAPGRDRSRRAKRRAPATTTRRRRQRCGPSKWASNAALTAESGCRAISLPSKATIDEWRSEGSGGRQFAPVGDRLGNVDRVDRRCAGKVGDRSRDLDDAMIAARRERHPRHRLREKRFGGGRAAAVTLDFARREAAIRLALTLELTSMREDDAVADGSRRLAVCGRRHGARLDRRHVDRHVDAVVERAGHAPAVTPNLLGRAETAAAAMAEPTARAWVHRRDELELGGERRLARRPGHENRPRFE